MPVSWLLRFAVVFAGTILAAPAPAQTTGTIEGNVVDALTRRPVADVVVIAQSPSVQEKQTAVTDGRGHFAIALLPGATYTMIVQREGYRPFTAEVPITVSPGQTTIANFSIVPQAIPPEEIAVFGARPAIDLGNAQSGGVVTQEQMQLIPYGRTQRNFESAATSVPGVHEDRYGLAMRGSGSPEGNYIIDGMNVTDGLAGTMGATLLQDFVQVVEVKTGGFQAEYGRSSGGVLSVVTKSGGNELHGSVFLNGSPFELPRRRVALGGTTIGVEETSHYSLDFGGELGGPIVRDRLWFFAGFAPQVTSLYEDRLILARVDDGSGQPVLGADGNPVVHEVARKRYEQTRRTLQFVGKLTWFVSENHTLALAAHGNPTTSRGALGNLSANEGAFMWQEDTGSTYASLRYGGSLFNRMTLVEATLGYYHQRGNPQFPSAQPIAVGDVSAELLRDTPRINWTQTRNLLDPAYHDATTPDYQRNLSACQVHPNGFDPCPVTGYSTGGVGLRLSENSLQRGSAGLRLTHFFNLAGRHRLKYGADASLDAYFRRLAFSGDARGDETDDGSLAVTQYGYEDPAHPGIPASDPARPGHLLGERPGTVSRNRSFAFFLQDTWSLSDRIVLDLGIRTEKQLMYMDRSRLDAQGNPLSGAQLALFNVMPRLGLIYDFTGSGLSKVYGSYGRFYELVPLNLVSSSFHSSGPRVDHVGVPGTCGPPAGAVLPQDPRFCAVVAPQTGSAFTFWGREADNFFAPNTQGQYVEEFQTGTQYQVLRDVVVGVDYVHRSIGRAIEDVSPDNGQTYIVTNPGEPGKPGYQTIIPPGFFFPRPRRIYDGVTLSVRKSFSQNYLVSASWTYSSLRGNFPGLFNRDSLDPNAGSEFDLAPLMLNRDGRLPADVANSFKLDAGCVVELSSRTRLQVGGNLRAQQGQPINYLGADPLYGPSEVFVLPRGSGGRLPWLWQIDVRTAATYRLTGPYEATLSLDIFNLTNNRAAIAVDEDYTFDPVSPIVGGSVRDLPNLKTVSGARVTVNPSYGKPTAYQLPLSGRIGVRLSF